MSDSSDSSKPRPKTAAVPHYTVGEEIMNSVTHGVGCLLGIAGLVLLIVFAALRGGGPAHMAAAIVYGVSIILEYLASTLYHAIQPARAKRVFRIIDHSCIYLLCGKYSSCSNQHFRELFCHQTDRLFCCRCTESYFCTWKSSFYKRLGKRHCILYIFQNYYRDNSHFMKSFC